MKPNDFTLIVPVRDRQYNLHKVAKYYKDLNTKKIIIDSSRKEYPDIALLEDSGFQYKHYSKKHYLYKMQETLYNIDTKYVVDCPDDDFIIKSSVAPCVDFLNDNENYSICDGLFLRSTGENDFNVKYYGSSYINNKSPEYTNIFERLQEVFGIPLYYPKNHSIIRTSVARKIYDFVTSNKKLQSIMFFDRYFSIIALNEGNHKVLPLPYCIRKEGTDRLVDRRNIQQEWSPTIHVPNCLNEEYLGELVLLISNKYNTNYNETFRFIVDIIGSHWVHLAEVKNAADHSEMLNKHNEEIQQALKIMWDEKFSRKEFETFRITEANRMDDDPPIRTMAINLIGEADKYHWIHQTNWMGEPVLQLPQDLNALQEIIFNTKPNIIIEVGVAWGGTTLFYTSLLKSLNINGMVLGIDKYMPNDLIDRLNNKIKNYNLAPVSFLCADSTAPETIQKVDSIVKDAEHVMVILDSNHTCDHVLNELNIYTKYLKKNDYIVCCDTIVEDLDNPTRQRQWDKNNNPRTALRLFLESNKNFEIDENIKSKLLISCNPDGYIKKVK